MYVSIDMVNMAICTHHTSDITHFLAAVGQGMTRGSEVVALSTNAAGLHLPSRMGYPHDNHGWSHSNNPHCFFGGSIYLFLSCFSQGVIITTIITWFCNRKKRK